MSYLNIPAHMVMMLYIQSLPISSKTTFELWRLKLEIFRALQYHLRSTNFRLSQHNSFTLFPFQQNFEYDEVKQLIEQSIEPVLGRQQYQPKRVPDWTSTIIDTTLKALQSHSKPFKYVVTAIIMQKNGAGLHTASTCFWDTKTDGSCSVRWYVMNG